MEKVIIVVVLCVIAIWLYTKLWRVIERKQHERFKELSDKYMDEILGIEKEKEE